MLEKETLLFEKKLPELLRTHPWGVALVRGERLEVFADEHEAAAAGRLCAPEPCLVRAILPPNADERFGIRVKSRRERGKGGACVSVFGYADGGAAAEGAAAADAGAAAGENAEV